MVEKTTVTRIPSALKQTNILSPREEPAVGCPELDFSQNSQGESIWTQQPFLYIQQSFLTRHMSANSREKEGVRPPHLKKHFYYQPSHHSLQILAAALLVQCKSSLDPTEFLFQLRVFKLCTRSCCRFKYKNVQLLSAIVRSPAPFKKNII